MRYFLVDNGSLRAESVLNLRWVAGEVSRASGLTIEPASLLHSSRVPASELGGEPAVNLERRMRRCLEAGERAFTVIPFFFGPTGALTDYLPKRLAFLRERYGPFELERAPFLHLESENGPGDLADLLADRVGECLEQRGWVRPRVALVDHGSPLAVVTAVRDALARSLADRLGDAAESVAPCSMERREGPEYAFNEPLLEHLLGEPGWRDGPVVVSLLFLSPGRHAGPGGDVAEICQRAEAAAPGLRTAMTGLLGTHPGIVPLLLRRLELPRVRL